MKNHHLNIGLAKLCGWFGVTRQAYYQNSWRDIEISIEEELIIKEVQSIRNNHKRMGVRKLYQKLEPVMQEHQVKMGRDALFNLLSAHGMLVRKRKRRIQTTQSSHWLRKYPNLIRTFIPTAPNQLWVSDITYWKIKNGHVYISFITDAYSHKIVGFHVAQTLETIETIQSLRMALSGLLNWPESHSSLVHHSDRGVQYCSGEYVKLLQKNNIKISMSENGDPLENAIAERINGIIKDEYLIDYTVSSLSEATAILKKSVLCYNQDRPHMSIGNKYPNDVHEKKIKTEKLWKNYYKKKPTIVNQF
jgi:transposase InsO family protein